MILQVLLKMQLILVMIEFHWIRFLEEMAHRIERPNLYYVGEFCHAFLEQYHLVHP
jgi:hypothetical protein